MKPKEIQELLDFIAHSGLQEVDIETENFKISVKRSATTSYSAPFLPPPLSAPIQIQNSTPAQPLVQEPVKVVQVVNDNHITIKSPMIGTYYSSSSPENPSFANVGDELQKGQTLCIIEAMKLFNEIEAEYSCRIVKVLINNATPVEFDQPLFVVEKI